MSVSAQNDGLQKALFAYTGNSEIVIGKDIMELLSSSMYINPLTIYREYIQNSVDAIDAAVDAGLLADRQDGRIDVMLDHINRRAIVRDNGIGLSQENFAARLTSFGDSMKRGTSARGFRGVGRLAGLGYCQELVFRSKTEQDEKVSVLKWDGKKLKQLLMDAEYKGDLSEIVKMVVSVSQEDMGERPSRFFEVEVIKPKRLGRDLLVNEVAITDYLSQVAPCPFNPAFEFATEICSFLLASGANPSGYNIFLNESEEPIYKSYANTIPYSENQKGALREIRTIEISGLEGEVAAVGWIAHHDYQGAIPVDAKVRGIRARVGNIQVGNDRIFSEIFPEERFCSWTIGELYILDARIMPNGRRDEFEQNNHLANIAMHLVPFGHEIARFCRSSSQRRNRRKSFDLAEQKVFERIEIIQQGAIPKASVSALKREIGTHVSDMRQITSFNLFSDGEQKALDSRLSKLELQLNSLADQQNSMKNPIKNLSKAKQVAYKEVFALLYECAQNKVVAKSLIDRMIDRISKS